MRKRDAAAGTTAAPDVLVHLERERRRQSGKKTDLRRDLRELNGLRILGAAINEHLVVPEILDALQRRLPELFDYAVLFVLVEGCPPALHVFRRGPAGPLEVAKGLESFLSRASHMRGEPLRASEVTLVETEHSPAPAAGRPRPLQSHITLPLVSGGDTVGCLSVASRRKDGFGERDVQLFSLISHQLATALRNALLLRQSWERAVYDALTGVFNRRHFDERFHEEYRRAQRYHHPFALILCDIDHFKAINDNLGHLPGDAALRRVATTLHAGLRNTDMLFRYGGEEFVIILPETSTEEGLIVAERLRAMVEQLDPVAPGLLLRVSCGVAGMGATHGEPGADVLLARADEALYLAKHCGRNRVCVALEDGRVEERTASTTDRRRFRRLAAQLPFRYVVVPEIGLDASAAETIEISREGLRVELSKDRPVPPGAFVLLEIGDERADNPVRLLTRVAWTEERDGRSFMGTRILTVDERSVKEFNSMLAKLEAAELPPPDGGTPEKKEKK